MARGKATGITTRIPAAPKRPKMVKVGGGERNMLTEPSGGYLASPYGRGAYRDAVPGFWGGNVLFGTRVSSANNDINRARDAGVANAREADRNHAFINAGITKRAVNTVGATLRLQYMPNWWKIGVDPMSQEAIDFIQTVENHWSLWGEDVRLGCDAQRQGQFGALMLLACRECLGTEGETLVVSRYDEVRQENYNLNYATFIEIVSCDRLSTPPMLPEMMPGNPTIVSGRELDEYGAAIAYHVRKHHPDEATVELPTWERVVRETDWGRPVGIHFFFRHRAGQQRSMPAIIQSLRSVKMLDKFDDAQLQAAVINAILSIYVESEGTKEEVLQKLTAQTPTGQGNILAELWDKRFDYYEENALYADGMRIPVLPPGDKIEMSNTSRAATDTKDFRSAFLRSMATQLNLTYEQFSGDYSATTFSSARSALMDVWRMVTADRILFTQHVAYPIFAGFMEELFVRADELGIKWPQGKTDFYEDMTAWTQCEFRGPGMGWVDPRNDAQASALRQEQGLTSATFEASQQGQSFTDNIDQIARDHAYARQAGVAIPGMPEYAALQAEARGRSSPNVVEDLNASDPNVDPNNPPVDPSQASPPSQSQDQQQQDQNTRDKNNQGN